MTEHRWCSEPFFFHAAVPFFEWINNCLLIQSNEKSYWQGRHVCVPLQANINKMWKEEISCQSLRLILYKIMQGTALQTCVGQKKMDKKQFKDFQTRCHLIFKITSLLIGSLLFSASFNPHKNLNEANSSVESWLPFNGAPSGSYRKVVWRQQSGNNTSTNTFIYVITESWKWWWKSHPVIIISNHERNNRDWLHNTTQKSHIKYSFPSTHR